MNILGKYMINVATKRAYLPEPLLPLFCRADQQNPGLEAYFSNTIKYERAAVEKQFFSALTNLSNFDIEHLIQANNSMIKIQNNGKVFIDEQSNAKKITGTIVNVDYLQTASVNWSATTKNVTVFQTEDLLNTFINRQKENDTNLELDLYLKIDMNLPKSLKGNKSFILNSLQQIYDEYTQMLTLEEVVITVKLMRENNDHVQVEFLVSANNKQASFNLQLEKVETINTLYKSHLTNAAKPLHILLVDDVEMNRFIAQNILQREFKQIEVDIAQNGLIAVEKVQQQSYDLILMDINMPVMDGLQATQKIRQELQCDIPIVALSAYAFPEQIQKCFHIGMNDFIAKPIDVRSLKQKIINILVSTFNGNKKPMNCPQNIDFDFNKRIAV